MSSRQRRLRFQTRSRSTRVWAAFPLALVLAVPAFVAPDGSGSGGSPPAGGASAQHAPPWDGNPISAGLGPTYGEKWCEPPVPGSGIADQQDSPLALIPGAAVDCTLQRFESEARRAGVPDRLSSSVIGSSVRGNDLHGVVVNARETPQQRRDFRRWVRLRSIMKSHPERAQSLLRAWGPDVKLPIFVEANIHGDEEEGTDAAMQVIRDLATTPYGTNAEVDALLDHAFLIVHPTINPDGRMASTRANSNGFDMNRDLLVQGQPEVRASITNMLEWLPPVGLTMHGYTAGVGAIQSMTKPHNPGYEYDLIAPWNQRRVDANEQDLDAVGMHPVRQVNDWNADAEPSPPPVGPEHAEGWDDWGPFYTAGHASTWAVDLQTVEMCEEGPGCNGRFGSKRMQYVAFHSSARFWIEHRDEILHDQLEMFRRGVADAERVDCCTDPLLADRGFTEEQHNWMVEYPKAYVIPFDGSPGGDRPGHGAQRSDAEANRLVRWLLDNGVRVHRTTRPVRWGGTVYPARSYVVPMDQAFRGLALTTLGAGQDISDRIGRLYAPPGAWSPGHIWGADVVEIPRGDADFDPRTVPVSAPNKLVGGVRPGERADWHAVTLRGPSEVRAVLDVLRGGADAEVAEAPFAAAGGRSMPAGSVVFGNDPRTVTALRAAGRRAGFLVERGTGPRPEATTVSGVPRVAVLVDDADPAMNDTLWSLRRMFGKDAEFVSVTAGADSLQNARRNPLRDFDVIYNAGQDYPEDAGTARTRLRAFLERGGGYIGTSQSANNFDFLNNAVPTLLDGDLTQDSQTAYGGIAKWANTGAAGPITSGYPDEDFLYLPTDVTYFGSLPSGAAVDGRYLDSTSDMFVAGLWRDRKEAAADAPVIVHGQTTVGSRYVALAANPFSRGDAEREWTMIAQAALWSDLTDDATAPADGPG